MRSKVFERVLDSMKKDSWFTKAKRWLRIEIYVIRCLGICKYVKERVMQP